MNISSENAEQALDAISSIEQRTVSYLEVKGADWLSWIWGLAWALGFSLQYWVVHYVGALEIGPIRSSSGGLLWFPVLALAGCASWWVTARQAPTRSERDQQLGQAIGLTWFALYAFWGFWMIVLSTGGRGHLFVGAEGARALSAIYATIPMLALVIMGLFGCGRWLVLEAVFITAATGIGLLLLQDGFYLYMAAVGGGSQILVGTMIRIKLRRA